MVVGWQNNLMKKIIIFNFTIVFLLIFFLELFSNLFKLSGLMGIESGLIYKKNNINYLRPNKDGIVFGQKVTIDQYGFRVPSKDFKYAENNNIFILGDSVTFGNGVKEEETFIGLLRKKFKNKNFLNSSVPGYQIKDHVNVINQSKKFNNIDKILYFFTLNDIYGSSNIVDIKNQKQNESDYSLKKYKIFNRLNAFLRNKSYLYMFIKGIGTDPSKRWFLNLFKTYENQNLDKVKNQFTLLDNYSKNIQSKFIVVLLPYEYQTRNCSKDILKPQNDILKILKDLNIDFKDFTKNFCKQNKPRKSFYKFDPMHLSKYGHKIVYNNLINEINF